MSKINNENINLDIYDQKKQKYQMELNQYNIEATPMTTKSENVGNVESLEVEEIDFSKLEKSMSFATENIEKIMDYNIKTSEIHKDGYTPSEMVETESGTIITATKEGESSRLYLLSGDLIAGIITMDSNEKIQTVDYNNENKTITIQLENGGTRVYREDRIKSSIALAQKYNGSSIGNYYETNGEKVVDVASDEIGKPYVWGACGPDSFDCSGFVGYCLTGQYERIGSTYTFMEWPETTDPQPGDICVSEAHTGIYIGDGQMIHAARPGVGVTIGPVQSNMKYVVYPE